MTMATHVQAVIDTVCEVSREKKASDEVVMLVRRKVSPRPLSFLSRSLREEVEEMIRKDDFSKATAQHFLALQDDLHTKLYGVSDPELNGHSIPIGVRRQVQGMLDAMGIDQVVAFMRWAWLEERRCEQWRRENHRDGSRLSVSRLFSRTKLTEYRISLARHGAKKG